ncbi:MAG: hypothetical protein DI586_04315 [Micavibrio aeruginosavorus]|uniref:Uncharacterized protein n=1 Tax=Micavibrio aeruginosavorus TaxID=349221 RepID=A0A2W5HRG1_9BACT|nr:MAG: hypothetical protein DI586_04315 [Micavibrio aeruginosavorus]
MLLNSITTTGTLIFRPSNIEDIKISDLLSFKKAGHSNDIDPVQLATYEIEIRNAFTEYFSFCYFYGHLSVEKNLFDRFKNNRIESGKKINSKLNKIRTASNRLVIDINKVANKKEAEKTKVHHKKQDTSKEKMLLMRKSSKSWRGKLISYLQHNSDSFIGMPAYTFLNSRMSKLGMSLIDLKQELKKPNISGKNEKLVSMLEILGLSDYEYNKKVLDLFGGDGSTMVDLSQMPTTTLHDQFIFRLITKTSKIWQDLTGRTTYDQSVNTQSEKRNHPYRDWLQDQMIKIGCPTLRKGVVLDAVKKLRQSWKKFPE